MIRVVKEGLSSSQCRGGNAEVGSFFPLDTPDSKQKFVMRNIAPNPGGPAQAETSATASDEVGGGTTQHDRSFHLKNDENLTLYTVTVTYSTSGGPLLITAIVTLDSEGVRVLGESYNPTPLPPTTSAAPAQTGYMTAPQPNLCPRSRPKGL